MDKKSAKAAMLKELSKEMSDDQYSPLKDLMKSKKMQKVSVVSDSPEGLKKGLSKAEQLLKMKGYESEDSEDESEEMEEPESAEEEMDEMSEEEMKAMYEMLKAKFGE